MSLERLLTLSIKDKEELAYWNELIPYMSELQKEKLYKILEAEQEELDRLEKKFGGCRNDKSKKEIYNEIFII